MAQPAAQKYGLLSLVLLIVPTCIVVPRVRDPIPHTESREGARQKQDPAAQNQPSPFTIQSKVNLVVLRASVRNRKGAPVSGLEKESFQVYEDGVLQQVESFTHEDVPVTIGLVIDGSGSMRPKRSDVIGAAVAFARSSNPEDQMFVVNFNEHVSLGLPKNTPFTNDPAQLEKALSRNVITGMTALYDAIAVALEQLQKGKWDKKVLIVVSDGGDNASKRSLAQIISMVNRSNAVIYTLGVFDDTDEDRNPRVLDQLSRATGGEAFFPRTLAEILPICEQIAHDIRSQYTITFESTNKKQSEAFRKINVKARNAAGGGRLLVITRSGYSLASNLPSSESSRDSRP